MTVLRRGRSWQSRKTHNKGYIRGIRLENICDTSNQEATDESVVPDVLPALFHVLVAGLDTEQPASRGVVVVTMVGSPEVAAGREALDVLRLAEQAARAKDMRHWSGRHLENGGGCEVARKSEAAQRRKVRDRG